MLPELGRIGSTTIQTYSVLLGLAILIGLGGLAWQGWRREKRPAAWLDAGLLGLIGGIIGGRAVHIVIHWAYFSESLADMYRVWQGGLGWQGAAAGGLLTLWTGSRLRGTDWRQMTDMLAFALPLGAALTYAGCLMASCAYGREVRTLADYPVLVVAELPDLYGITAPRFSSQLFGIALSLLVLALAGLLSRVIRRPGVRFWPVLALLALGIFGIGFTRGDAVPMVNALRLDQVLDLAVMVLGAGGTFAALWGAQRSEPGAEKGVQDAV